MVHGWNQRAPFFSIPRLEGPLPAGAAKILLALHKFIKFDLNHIQKLTISIVYIYVPFISILLTEFKEPFSKVIVVGYV